MKTNNGKSKASMILRGYCSQRRHGVICEMTGISRSTLYKRLSDPGEMKLSELLALRMVLGISDEHLIAIIDSLRPQH